MNIIIKAENISKKYRINTNKSLSLKKNIFYALKDVSYEIKQNSILGIVGESGSGKTTLARILLKITKPDTGDIFFKGKNILDFKGNNLKKYRKSVQIIFQNPYSSLNPRHKIKKIIEEGIKIHNLYKSEDERLNRVKKLINIVGLSETDLDKYPHQFSGGQRQRICIARALSVEPEIIIADEPVSSLDVSIQSQIINLLLKLKKQHNLTYVFISHDISLVNYLADEVIVLYGGEIMEYGATEDVIKKPFHPYTKLLINAIPEIGKKKIDTDDEKNGCSSTNLTIDNRLCPFLHRCKEKLPICSAKKPELKIINDSRKINCFLT